MNSRIKAHLELICATGTGCAILTTSAGINHSPVPSGLALAVCAWLKAGQDAGLWPKAGHCCSAGCPLHTGFLLQCSGLCQHWVPSPALGSCSNPGFLLQPWIRVPAQGAFSSSIFLFQP